MTTIESDFIHPTKKYNRPCPSSTIPLHGLDLLGAPMDIRNHRFYHRCTTTDIIDKLKSSLAEALELYPPVTGIVRANEQGELYIDLDAKSSPGTPFLVEIKDTPYVGDTDDLSPRPLMLPPLSSTLAVKITQVIKTQQLFFVIIFFF